MPMIVPTVAKRNKGAMIRVILRRPRRSPLPQSSCAGVPCTRLPAGRTFVVVPGKGSTTTSYALGHGSLSDSVNV